MAAASLQSESSSGSLTKLLALALDACGDGVVVFDDAGAVVYANPPARTFLSTAVVRPGAERASLQPLLDERAARAIPLRAGSAQFGEAVFLPGRAGDTLADRERRAIIETLEATRWRLSETARRLGISRTTLWRRVRTYGLARRGDTASV
jgi:transcriptional regulator of acetoin/glycerol metabolism